MMGPSMPISRNGNGGKAMVPLLVVDSPGVGDEGATSDDPDSGG